MFRIATWNVNSLRVRLPQVLQWLEREAPDVLALQETKLEDDKFPEQPIRDAGYHVVYSGQKTYNGVATLSKIAPGDVVAGLPSYDDAARRALCARFDVVVVLNLYVPNGATVDSEKYRYKLEWLQRLIAYTETLVNTHEYVVLLGDFNVAPEDRDVHAPELWEGSVLVSPAEREQFRALLEQSLVDCFRCMQPEERGFSWWDYRAASFQRDRGLRIDHILATDSLAELCRACYVDRTPRGLPRPSDHTPVVAEFDL